MKLRLHTIAHFVAMLIHAIAALDISGFVGFLPHKTASWIMVIVGGAQSLIAIYNHFFNPDGTPAQAAWQPK